MPNKIKLAKRSEKGLLTPDNCVVTIIDLQPQMLFGVSNAHTPALTFDPVACLASGLARSASDRLLIEVMLRP